MWQPARVEYNFPSLDLEPSTTNEQVPSPTQSLKIRLRPMAPASRPSTRQHTSSLPSGSEYNESNNSMDEDEDVKEEEQPQPEEEEPKEAITYTSRGRAVKQKSYAESERGTRCCCVAKAAEEQATRVALSGMEL